MGVRFPSVASTTIVTVSVPAAETVIVTTPPLNISLDFAQIILLWYVLLTSGTGTTSLVYLLRRGTTTAGALLNVSAIDQTTAGNNTRRSGVYVDTPGAVAAQQYSLTLAQTGLTVNGTVLDVCMIAFAL